MGKNALPTVVLTFAIALPLGAQAAPQAEGAWDWPAVNQAAVNRFGRAFATAQMQALSRVQDAEVVYSKQGTPWLLRGRLSLPAPARLRTSPSDSDSEMKSELGGILGLGNSDSLRRTRLATLDSEGRISIRYQHEFRGVPVEGATVTIVYGPSGDVELVASTIVPQFATSAVPRISASDVSMLLSRQLSELYARSGLFVSTEAPTLVFAEDVNSQDQSAKALLQWKVYGEFTAEKGKRLVAYVDATDGRVLELADTSAHADVYVFDGTINGKMQLYTYPSWEANLRQSQNVLASPTKAPTTADALTVLNYANLARSAWIDLGRADVGNAYPNPVNLVINYGEAENARYIGPGSGLSQEYFAFSPATPNRLAFWNSLDVVSHEFGHSIVQRTAGLQYSATYASESAALNEAFGDFSSTVTDVFTYGAGVQARAQTWELAEVVMPPPRLPQLRSWSQPKMVADSFPIPTRGYADWYPFRSTAALDQGTPHFNSTIMGHAYYLLVNGGVHRAYGPSRPELPYINVPSIPVRNAQRIFRYALETLLGPTSTFMDAKSATIAAAQALYPGTSHATSVELAWNAVGVGYGCVRPPQVPVLYKDNERCYGRYNFWWDPVPDATLYSMHVSTSSAFLSEFTYTGTDVFSDTTTCYREFATTVYAHLRACNGCGCSDWSPAKTALYYAYCR